MEGLLSFLDSAKRECESERGALLGETKRHQLMALSDMEVDHELLRKTELSALDNQNEALEQVLAGVTGLSEEVLLEVHRLKRKKVNTDNLLNTLTSMTQAKVLVGKLDSFDENSSLDNLKKFVIEMYYSLETVPKKYFEHELELYERFTQRMMTILRSKLDIAIHKRRVGEASTIASLAKIMRLDFDVNKKFEEVLLADVRNKIEVVESQIDKKIKSFGTIRNCIGTEAQSLRIELEDQTTYPEIFFHGVIDALTVLYESLAGLKESSFLMESESAFKLMLVSLFDHLLADFLQKTRVKMDAFFGVDLGAILSKQEEITITIERDGGSGRRATHKRNEELAVLEYYLLEVVNIASQSRLFGDEVSQELLSLVSMPQHQAFFTPALWKESEVKRLVASYSFNAEAAELMAYYKVIQEKVWKSRLAAILSDSRALRVLFYGTAAEIGQFVSGGLGDDSKSESSASRDGSTYEYLDEIFYTLHGGLTRAIRSLDKVTSCSLIGFAGGTVLCNDLFKLSRQLVHRFLELAGNDSADGVALSKEDLGFNRGMCTALNSLAIAEEFVQKLSEQIQTATKRQYESAGDVADLPIILESCRSIESQTVRTYQTLIQTSIKSLVDKFLKAGITSLLQSYQSFDFALTEKVFQEMEAFPTKWSVTARVARRLKGTLDSWKEHLRPAIYDMFCSEFAKSTAESMLAIIFKKKFNTLGALFIDKEVRQMQAALQAASDQTLVKQFSRLSAATEVLLADSKEEAYSFGRQSLSDKEVEDLLRQRLTSL
jgi:hypothetical protein